MGSIGDRVWRDDIGGGDGIQDPGEPGLANVPINLYSDPGEGHGTLALVATNITDANGFYVFTNLPPGAYVVKVITNSVLTGFTQSGDPDYHGIRLPDDAGDNCTTVPIALSSGQAFTNADFGYWRAPFLLAVIGNIEAFTRAGQTIVRWETIESWGTAGFYLERLVGTEWVRISKSLLPFPLFGTPPIVYEEVDPEALAGGTYLWRLVELEYDGNELIYGPYSLTVNGPGRTFSDWIAMHFTGDQQEDPSISGRDRDPDGDTLTNWQEFLAGTNPNSADSVLQITEVRKVPGGIELRWDSVAGRTYRIAVSESIFSPFLPLDHKILATDGNGRLTLTTNFGSRQMFYQVIASME